MAKNNYSGEKKRRGIFRRLMARPFLVLGWIVAGIACLLLAVFVFYSHRNALMSLLSDLKTGPKIFHTKIPEEIRVAQNLFRGKIPAVDQPLKPPTKIENMPPVEKKAVPSQPIVAPPEISEPPQKAELVQPVETQTKIETTPPMAQAVLSEPIIAPPEQIEPLRETALPQPIESSIINETTSPVAKAVPFQPIDASSEKGEPRQEPEPHPPAEPPTKIEAILPAEELSVSSQPTVAPSEKRELPEKADLPRAEVHPQPFKEDVIVKTEERIIHSEKWLLSQESSFYTIQLMGARKEALLFNFVEKNRLLEQNEIAYYQTTFKGKPWFQLLYGVYAAKKDAQSVADNLPPKIRKSSPWIRRLSAVQKAIRGKMSP
jgi:septal ring-binding cell division protein DamX